MPPLIFRTAAAVGAGVKSEARVNVKLFRSSVPAPILRELQALLDGKVNVPPLPLIFRVALV